MDIAVTEEYHNIAIAITEVYQNMDIEIAKLGVNNNRYLKV